MRTRGVVKVCSWWVRRRVERGAKVFELWKRVRREDARSAVAMGGAGVAAAGSVATEGSVEGEGSAAGALAGLESCWVSGMVQENVDVGVGERAAGDVGVSNIALIQLMMMMDGNFYGGSTGLGFAYGYFVECIERCSEGVGGLRNIILEILELESKISTGHCQ